MVRDLFDANENKRVHDDLFVPIVDLFKMFAKEHQDYLDSPHNRSAVCTAGTLMAGYATDDAAMVNEALYGVGGTPENPGGLMGVHFSEKCLLPDGLWIEGAPGYQIGILSSAVFNDAETLWHHGIDMYRYRGGALKRLLDSAIVLAYPDDKMDEPALHDSSALALLDDRGWFNNEAGRAVRVRLPALPRPALRPDHQERDEDAFPDDPFGSAVAVPGLARAGDQAAAAAGERELLLGGLRRSAGGVAGRADPVAAGVRPQRRALASRRSWASMSMRSACLSCSSPA